MATAMMGTVTEAIMAQAPKPLPAKLPAPKPADDRAQVRLVALVIAGTMVAWMGAQWLGGQMGWPVRYVLLFDFAALAGFVWALLVTYRIWRRRQG